MKTERQRDRETERQRGGEGERERGREIERERERESERERGRLSERLREERERTTGKIWSQRYSPEALPIINIRVPQIANPFFLEKYNNDDDD